MISRWLLYVCLVGAGGCAIWAAGLWIAQHGLAPVGRLTCAYRRLPWPLKFLLALYLGIWIVYGSTKAPTNPPSQTAASPRRASRAAPDELWRVGTNENWNFNCPAWATVVEPWERRGAFDDWASAGEFGVLFAEGRIRFDGTMIALYDRPLALVPGAVKVGTNGLSRVWYGRSPWHSEVWTWQNAYADRDTNAVVSVQFERLVNGDRIYRYGGFAPVTSRAYLSPRPSDADSDGDGIPDAVDAAMMDPDADGDGLVDGMSRAAYDAHPLWRENSSEGELIDIRLQEPVVAPAKAVLTIGTLRILLTTNAVYHLCLQPGNRYEVKLTTNGFQPVNLTVEPGAEPEGGVLITGDVFGAAATSGEGAIAAVRLKLEPESSTCIHTTQDWVDFKPVFLPSLPGLAVESSMLEGFTLNSNGTVRLSLSGAAAATGRVTLGVPPLSWGGLSVEASIHLCYGGVQAWCYACGRLHGIGEGIDCSHAIDCAARFSSDEDCTCPPLFIRVNWDDDDFNSVEDRNEALLVASENEMIAYRALGVTEDCWCHPVEMSGSRVAGLTSSSELRLWGASGLAGESASAFEVEAVRASDDIGSGYFQYDVYDATNGFLRTVTRQVTAANLELRPDWDDSGEVDFQDRWRLRSDVRPSRWQLRVRDTPYLCQLASECPMAMALAFGQHCTRGAAPALVAANGTGVPTKNCLQNVLIDTSAGEGDLALEFALGLSAAETNLVDTLAIHVVDASVKERWAVVGATAGVTYDYSSVDGEVCWNVWRYTDGGCEWLDGGSDHVFTLSGLAAGDYKVEVYFDGIYDDGAQGYTATGDFHVLDVRLERLYETANPANRIFNPTRKDDTTGNADAPTETVYAGTDCEERYAALRNAVYLVGDPTNGNFNVTAAFDVTGAGAGCPPFHCAFFDDQRKIEGSETNLDLTAETHAIFSIPAPSIPTDVVYELRGGFDLNENGQLDAGEAVRFVTHYVESDNTPRYACIKGITKEKYEWCRRFLFLGLVPKDKDTMVFSAARTLMTYFCEARGLNEVGGAYGPDGQSEVLLDAFSTNCSCFCEWLTHNSGASFNAIGVATIRRYYWNEDSALSELIARQPPLSPTEKTFGWVTQTELGSALKNYFETNLLSAAIEYFQSHNDSDEVTLPLSGWLSGTVAEQMFVKTNPAWVPGVTVDIGSGSLAFLLTDEYDSHASVGRGRLLNPQYQFVIQRLSYPDGVSEYFVRKINFKCRLEDLYDFNYEDSIPANFAAVLQI